MFLDIRGNRGPLSAADIALQAEVASGTHIAT
jgi:hypothetical protein